MPRFFQSPDGAPKQEEILFPDKLTQSELITDDALVCPLYVQHAMLSEHGVNLSLRELISEAVADWYEDKGQYMMGDYEPKVAAKPAPKKGKAKKLQPPTFQQRISNEDAILARGMGIRLD